MKFFCDGAVDVAMASRKLLLVKGEVYDWVGRVSVCVCVSGYRIGGGDMVNDAMPIARLLPPTITHQHYCP